MNWTRALVAGIVGGIVVSIANFVMHGIIMQATYMKYPVFTREEANPLWFFVVAIFIALPAAVVFSRTRSIWGKGIAGGLSFGFWIGLIAFFREFYNPLVLEGYPYYLGWCQGGIALIGFLVLGVVLALMVKD